MTGGKARIPEPLRERVSHLAGHRCGYCLCTPALLGMPMSIDHIIPESAGGPTTEENLWLACRRCNEFKGSQTAALDPETGVETPLFHPRRDEWHQHFRWSADGASIVAKTACGRATCRALRLNNDIIVVSRRLWVSAGFWPPRS